MGYAALSFRVKIDCYNNINTLYINIIHIDYSAYVVESFVVCLLCEFCVRVQNIELICYLSVDMINSCFLYNYLVTLPIR